MIYRLLSLCRRFGRLVPVGVVAAAIVAVAATSPWASRATTAPERSESNAKLPGVSQPITKPQPPDPERAPRSGGSDSPAEGNKPTFMGPRQRQRGVALGLFAEDTSFSYGPLLAEIAALGASHVALVVPIYQQHGESTSLYLHTRFSPTLDAVAEAVRLARQQRLEVTLFPIVRLEAPRTAQEWRGTLAPADPAMWFASYGEILGSLAALGSLTGATRLVIGSELSTLDNLTASWAPLLERIRAVFAGTLDLDIDVRNYVPEYKFPNSYAYPLEDGKFQRQPLPNSLIRY